ncbi:chymotrypsin-like elastase family member 2A [Lepeophtheirus salmonis]|uniref:chymotrypsin-like elastase family member 2A n=1 Tax=Lepeophtheirus salmonis TaxID=72036 RepID=UPI001AE48E9B|nr:CLIP domain-containing serine protease B15-like [Lepeophtheirus salmonis]
MWINFVIISIVFFSAIMSSSLPEPRMVNESKEAGEICSCGLKVIVNGTDSFFLKSPNYSNNPCIWEFHVLPEVSVEINCFMHGIHGVQLSPSRCAEDGDSFSITHFEVTEAHCNPFHHFSKKVAASPVGYLIMMEFKRRQLFETVGETFECSITGSYNDTDTLNSSKIKDNQRSRTDTTDLNHESCGKVNFPLRRMTNGEIVSPEEYPWIVPISIEGDRLCGGAIVGSYWILTSAHCLGKAHWAKLYFGVREYGLYDDFQIAQEFIIHPEYDFPTHDIALIKLPQGLSFNRFIRTVCLPTEAERENIFMAFGWSTNSDNESNKYLRGTFLNKVTLESCRTQYASPGLSEDIICTNTPTKCIEGKNSEQIPEFATSSLGSMQSDRFFIQGIASFTSNTCNESIPTGFTRIFPYVKWIHDVINKGPSSIKLLPLFDILDHGF